MVKKMEKSPSNKKDEQKSKHAIKRKDKPIKTHFTKKQLSSIHIDQKIGHGAFGTIYSGTLIDQAIIAKFISSKKQAWVQAKILSMLQDCGIFVSYYGLVESPQCNGAFLIQQQLDFTVDYVLNKGSLKKSEVFFIFKKVIQQLKVLSQLHIVHRDLKFNNIMIGQRGVYIIDFGLGAIRNSYEKQEQNDYLRGASVLWSINAHKNQTQMPSDDAQTFGYLMFSTYNQLPWTSICRKYRKRREFLHQLKDHLVQCPKKERDENLRKHEKMIDDMNEKYLPAILASKIQFKEIIQKIKFPVQLKIQSLHNNYLENVPFRVVKYMQHIYAHMYTGDGKLDYEFLSKLFKVSNLPQTFGWQEFPLRKANKRHIVNQNIMEFIPVPKNGFDASSSDSSQSDSQSLQKMQIVLQMVQESVKQDKTVVRKLNQNVIDLISTPQDKIDMGDEKTRKIVKTTQTMERIDLKSINLQSIMHDKPTHDLWLKKRQISNFNIMQIVARISGNQVKMIRDYAYHSYSSTLGLSEFLRNRTQNGVILLHQDRVAVFNHFFVVLKIGNKFISYNSIPQSDPQIRGYDPIKLTPSKYLKVQKENFSCGFWSALWILKIKQIGLQKMLILESKI